jgi:ribonuclease HII
MTNFFFKFNIFFRVCVFSSIVAKVSRDKSILRICEEHPNMAKLYGWSSNKGYLSQQHTSSIREYGLSDFHRKSFDYKCLK